MYKLLTAFIIVKVVQAPGFRSWGVNPSVHQSNSVYLFPAVTCSTFSKCSPGTFVQLIETFCEAFPVDAGDCLLVEYFAVVSVYARDNVIEVPYRSCIYWQRNSSTDRQMYFCSIHFQITKSFVDDAI